MGWFTKQKSSDLIILDETKWAKCNGKCGNLSVMGNSDSASNCLTDANDAYNRWKFTYEDCDDVSWDYVILEGDGNNLPDTYGCCGRYFEKHTPVARKITYSTPWKMNHHILMVTYRLENGGLFRKSRYARILFVDGERIQFSSLDQINDYLINKYVKELELKNVRIYTKEFGSAWARLFS